MARLQALERTLFMRRPDAGSARAPFTDSDALIA